MNKRPHLVAFASLVLAAAACSGADEHPLGGPYGGSTSSAQPPAGGDDDTGGGADASQGTGHVKTDSGAGGGGTPDSSTGGGDPPDSSTGGGDHPDSSIGGGGADASQPPPPPPSPTWTFIVNTYLKSGTVGNCGSSGCHSQMNTPSAAFTWIKGKGCGGSTLTDSQSSCLTWYGGNMPPHGPSSAAAASTDMEAWVAAGAKNN